MRFTKMQGIGNDYVYIDGTKETIGDPGALAQKVSDRHFGIGSDGLIIIRSSKTADFEMDMYNADGSRGKMCGNGIRCVGKYVYDKGLTDRTHLRIATPAGIRTLDLYLKDGKTDQVRVDMGVPSFAPEKVPVRSEHPVISQEVAACGRTWRQTCVSMGNPHTVVPVEDPYRLDLSVIGPVFENLPIFPERVNTEFIHVTDRKNVIMRVWERGSGETWACGTGACAVTAACIINGWTEKEITVHLRGGDLKISWDGEDRNLFMTGPARTVFEGEFDPAGL